MYFLYCISPKEKKLPTKPKHLMDSKGFAWIATSELAPVIYRELQEAKESNYFPKKTKRYFILYVLSGKWDFHALHIYSAKEWIKNNLDNIKKEPGAMSDRLSYQFYSHKDTHITTVVLAHDQARGYFRNNDLSLEYREKFDRHKKEDK